MGLHGAEQVLLFDAVFVFMMTLFGATAGGSHSLQALSSIQPPTLAPLPGAVNCNPLDYICNSSKDIVRATAYIGWAIINIPVVLLFTINEFIVFMNVALGIAFDPAFGANGIPILGFLFSALQLVVVFEIFRMFRGSSSGL